MTSNCIFEEAVRRVHERYARYGNRGKPESNVQWTHIAAFFTINDQAKDIDILSVCTGTKCVTNSTFNYTGCRILDSHAEILAKRAFVRYLWELIVNSLETPCTSNSHTKFIICDGTKFRWDESYLLYMYSSHIPCGAAGNDLHADSDYNPIEKIARLDDDDRNCVDSFCRKPGRGEPTLSMSCSDKLTKWCVMGVQGALLANYLYQPIYLKGIVLNESFSVCKSSLERLIIGRTLNWSASDKKYSPHTPTIHFVFQSFPWSRECVQQKCVQSQIHSSHLSFIWYPTLTLPEVLVNGYKQGVSKKNLGTDKSQSTLCRMHMVRMLMRCQSLSQEIAKSDGSKRTYRDTKNTDYINAWNLLKIYFADWNMHENKLKAQTFAIPDCKDK